MIDIETMRLVATSAAIRGEPVVITAEDMLELLDMAEEKIGRPLGFDDPDTSEDDPRVTS